MLLQQCIEIGLSEISGEAAREGLLAGRWIWKIYNVSSAVHDVSLVLLDG
jgi:hypothetical protein